VGLRVYVSTELDEVPSSPRPELGPKVPQAWLRKPQMPGCKPITNRYYQFDYTENQHKVKTQMMRAVP
jgi:hypothetical protein